MAVPRALILSVVAVAIICSVCSVTDAKMCGVDQDCTVPGANTTCVEGTCKYVCPSLNYRDCDEDMSNGCEVDITTDKENCGGCKIVCPAPYNAVATCQGMRCVISGGSGGQFGY